MLADILVQDYKELQHKVIAVELLDMEILAQVEEMDVQAEEAEQDLLHLAMILHQMDKWVAMVVCTGMRMEHQHIMQAEAAEEITEMEHHLVEGRAEAELETIQQERQILEAVEEHLQEVILIMEALE